MYQLRQAVVVLLGTSDQVLPVSQPSGTVATGFYWLVALIGTVTPLTAR